MTGMDSKRATKCIATVLDVSLAESLVGLHYWTQERVPTATNIVIVVVVVVGIHVVIRFSNP